MTLTPDQLQKMRQVATGNSSSPSSVVAQASQVQNPDQPQGLQGEVRNVSNVLQQLGLGILPEVGEAGYDVARAGESALGNKSVWQQTSPFMSQQQLAQYQTPTGAAGEALKNVAGGEAWAAGGLNPLGWALKPLLARAGIGGLSAVGQNIAQGQGRNIGSDLQAFGIGAGANAVLPQAAVSGIGNIAKLAYGKAGTILPAIGRETGKTITGIGSKGAKAAVANIGQKIGDVFAKTKTGLMKNEIFGQFNDIPQISQTGLAAPTALDNFLKQAGINAENKTAAQKLLQTMMSGSQTRLQRGLAGKSLSQTTGAIEKEFNAALNDYLSKNPDVAQQVSTQGIDNVQLPAKFWQDFKESVRPAESVYNQIKNNPLYNPSTEDKLRIAISKDVGKKLQANLANTFNAPASVSRMQDLNKLYGSAKQIASGEAKGMLPQHYQMLAPLAATYLTAAPLLGAPALGGYMGMLGALGYLANPVASGAVASNVAKPAVQALMNALTSLGASKLSNQGVQ